MRKRLYETYQHIVGLSDHQRCISIYDLRSLNEYVIQLYRQVPALHTALKLQPHILLDTFIGRHHDIILTVTTQRRIIKQFPNPYTRSSVGDKPS